MGFTFSPQQPQVPRNSHGRRDSCCLCAGAFDQRSCSHIVEGLALPASQGGLVSASYQESYGTEFIKQEKDLDAGSGNK